MFHARTANKGMTGRDKFVRRVHWASDGMPVLDMETEEELRPELWEVVVAVRVFEPEDEYGYLMAHFIEHPEGYAEKINLDLSHGDDPEQWDRLNGGESILASNRSTTGVRDPFLTYDPKTNTLYILATDLRVFGGDAARWGGRTRDSSTKINIWESTDLVTWTDFRQLDVAPNAAGRPTRTPPI